MSFPAALGQITFRFRPAHRHQEKPMRAVIIAVIVIAIAAAALWYTPQGRGLLARFGIATADCIGGYPQSA